MVTHTQHHFVPRFMLEQWHSGTDAKLSVFRWTHGKLDVQRHKSKSVAKHTHLYSLARTSGEPDVAIERDFLGPFVDEPAAAVHRSILLSGLSAITDRQQHTWARFIASLIVRGPEMIQHLKSLGEAELAAALNEAPEAYADVRGDSPEKTLLEFVKAQNPVMLSNFGIQLLPQVLDHDNFLGPLLQDKLWMLRPLHDAKDDLLIGDRPVVQAGSIDAAHVFVVPISPRHLFAIGSSRDVVNRIAAMPCDELVSKVNAASVQRAQTYVFATARHHESLIRDLLNNADDG